MTRPFQYRTRTLCNCTFEAYFEREADSPKLLETLKTQGNGWRVWKEQTRLQSRRSPRIPFAVRPKIFCLRARKALERFIRQEPLRRVHECVFGVLALESEPVDPRL